MNRLLRCAGFASLVALALAAPAAAQEPESRGWFLALDLALTQPTGADTHLATRFDNTVFPPVTERILLENDDDSTLRFSAGYHFGLDMGTLQASWWEFDNEDEEAFSRTGLIQPALFGYGAYGYMTLCSGGDIFSCDPGQPVSFSGRSRIQATTLDLDYTKTAEVGERFHLQWLAGLRTAHYEEETGWEGFNGYYSYRQDRQFESDALGIRVGAAGILQVIEHFGLKGGLALSLLQADTTGRASQTFVDLGLQETAFGEDHNQRGQIQELEVSGVWSAGPVNISLGISNADWQGLVKDPVPVAGFLGVSETSTRDSIGFTSFVVGVKWSIGAGRGVSAP
jgi:hypothetical protein